jgi:hypothetical protein
MIIIIIIEYLMLLTFHKSGFDVDVLFFLQDYYSTEFCPSLLGTVVLTFLLCISEILMRSALLLNLKLPFC